MLFENLKFQLAHQLRPNSNMERAGQPLDDIENQPVSTVERQIIKYS
jgi:hypothetical protein